jgi:hypothetical protein
MAVIPRPAAPGRWATTGPGLAVAAAFAAASGWLLVRSPVVAVGVAAPLAVAAVLFAISPRKAIAGLIIYFPLETIVLNAVPASLVPPIRYAPELVGLGAAAVLLLRRGNEILARLWPLIVPLGLILLISVASWYQSKFSLSTAILGLRAELRFLPYAVIAAAVLDARRDARLIGRSVCIAGAVQCLIAVSQMAGGVGVAQFFVPRYSVTIGGTEVQPAGEFRAHTIFGSVTNYNYLAIFLLFCMAVTFALGAAKLGMPVWLWRSLLASDFVVLVASGSREGLVAFLLVAAVFLRLRRGVGVPILAVLILVAVALAAPTGGRANNGAAFVSRNLLSRWGALFQSSAYSSNPNSPNFRLALLRSEVGIAAGRGILLGAGAGSVVDRRTLDAGTNPLFDSAVGQIAIAFSFQYDENWGLLLVEVGILGLLAYAGLLAGVAAIAVPRRNIWCGEALCALLPAVVSLGFFAAVLQLRVPTLLLWVLTGLCASAPKANARANSRSSEPPPTKVADRWT